VSPEESKATPNTKWEAVGVLLGPTTEHRVPKIMRRANMAAADNAWFYKPKRGRYRHRTDVRFGSKATKGGANLSKLNLV
jgi:hypothetical protein